MKHIHLDSCDSTQDYLKEQLAQDQSEELLISCENQIQGHGRNQKKWEPLPHSLYFSFIVKPNEKVTWTAIELSVIISDYFFKRFGEELKLKWPNDIYDSRSKKCGGILVQQSHQKNIAGIGLNLESNQEWGGIFEKSPTQFSKKEWCADIVEYIMQNRISNTNDLRMRFLNRCMHYERQVSITEGDETHSGIFIGLGDWGEALIKDEQKTHHLYNGSLRW